MIDHKPLKHLQKVKDDSILLFNWSSYLSTLGLPELHPEEPAVTSVFASENFSDVSRQLQIIEEAHRLVHDKQNRMIKTIKQRFYWKNMQQMVREFTDKCIRCQRQNKTFPFTDLKYHFHEDQLLFRGYR